MTGRRFVQLSDGTNVADVTPPGAYASVAVPTNGHLYVNFPNGLYAIVPAS